MVAKRLYVWLVVAAVAAVALLVLVMRSSLDRITPETNASAVQNLVVSIDGQTFTIKDGRAEPDDLHVVGEPVSGADSGDGKPDAALLLRHNPGGSGDFYYAVIAVDDGTGYHATNTLLLGDRIRPTTITVDADRFVYHFLDRKPDEPMAAKPTVERSVTVGFDPSTGRISAIS